MADTGRPEDGGPGERPGDVIDRYKLLQEIGEGGMGAVWMAEQREPVKRKVALKIIKLGMDTKEVVARFEAERQALAMMDHPNIAKVLDGGATGTGRPYFAMELVRGVAITDYCERNRLDIGARLELFARVCDAIQHAHHKGIIHRDIKPTNVMVTLHDGVPVPKVIDFGIAKATNAELTSKTLFTRYQQMVGTPDYMAPEQAEMSGLDVDTRADVYSLGVLLYELLTGSKPFDAETALRKGYSELLRTIREDVPARPSTRIANARLLRDELDWIAMRALEKDRDRRYDTAAAFAADVRRYLHGEPVHAVPPSALYRLRKFARRHAGMLAAAAAVLAVLTAVGWWQLRRADDIARELAAHSQLTAGAIEAASLALGQAIAAPIASSSEWVGADAAARRVLDLLSEGDVDDDVRERAQVLLERVDEARSERDLAIRLENVLITCASHPDLASWQRMADELAALLAAHGIDLAADEPMTVARKIREHVFAIRLADVLELWIATRAHMASMGGPPATRERMQPWADAIYAADPDPLRTGIRRIIYEQRQPDRSELDALIDGVDLETLPPRTRSWISTIYAMSGFGDVADEMARDSIRRFPRDAMLAFDRGYGLALLGRHEEAVRMFSRSLAIRPDAAGIWRMMGNSLAQLGELGNAREALEESCRLEDYGPSWLNLGEVLLRLEDGPAAARAGRRAVALLPNEPAAYGVLGRALMLQEEWAHALPALEECHRLGEADDGWRQPSAEWLARCRDAIAGR